MANSWYLKAIDGLMKAQIDLSTDDIRIIGVDTGAYTVNLSTHEFLSDLGAGAIGTAVALAGKSVSGGVFDATDSSLTIAFGQPTIEALVIYKHTGVAGTSRLILYVDSVVSGLPFTPSGNPVPIEFDGGAAKIARIAI